MKCSQLDRECADAARRREFTAHQTHDVKIPLSVSKRIPETGRSAANPVAAVRIRYHEAGLRERAKRVSPTAWIPDNQGYLELAIAIC
jgi:hypothetical protein